MNALPAPQPYSVQRAPALSLQVLCLYLGERPLCNPTLTLQAHLLQVFRLYGLQQINALSATLP